MKKIGKLSIVIVILLMIGSTWYKNSSLYVNSNHYLSSRGETEKSVYSMTNGKDAEDGKSFDFSKFKGQWSIIEFTTDKDNKITIKDNTKISEGIFHIVVLDSDYNIITKKKESNTNENANIDFTVPKSGKYTIRIVGKNATGNFNIKVNASNKINLSHKEFFS